MLPRGFEYLSFGWRGETMTDGRPTPGAHDGMGAFRDGDRVRLVRNHELRNATPFADGAATCDPLAAGGTTTLTFDPDAGRLVEHFASLSGTFATARAAPPAGQLAVLRGDHPGERRRSATASSSRSRPPAWVTRPRSR